MISSLILACVWFALFVVGHLIYFNINPAALRAKFITNLFVLTLLGYLVSTILLFQGNVMMSLLWGWLTLFSFFVLYMPFYYVIATSLSVQSMILVQTEGRYPLQQLQETFVSKNLVGNRLSLMVTNDYLIEVNGRYSLTSKGRRIAHIFLFFKNLWKLGAGG